MSGARITFRPVDPAEDAPVLHRWVTHPRSVFWQMQEADRAQVRAAYLAIDRDPHHHALLGLVDGCPQLLVERYDPQRRELVGVPEICEGDVGMHLLVAPTDHPVHGFTARALAAAVRHCLERPGARRVVVEPDERNTRIARLNAAAGFRVLRRLHLPTKVAVLSAVTPEQFAASPIGAAR